MTDRLKLIAMDAEDLAILSAHCQDAVLKVGDLAFLPKERRFALAMNRFVWEEAANRRSSFERRRSVLHFERVEAVRTLKLDRRRTETILELLAVTFTAKDEPAGTVELAFAGGATLQFDVECIEAQLTDTAAAWETKNLPAHDDGR
jgi:hypothetical protein